MLTKEDKLQTQTIKGYSTSNLTTRKDAVSLRTPAMLDQPLEPEKSVTPNPKSRNASEAQSIRGKDNKRMKVTLKSPELPYYEKQLSVVRRE